MAQFNASYGYDWQSSRYSTNTLTLFKLTYTKLLNTTNAFDSIMAENNAIALSFQSQFMPQMMYTYTYDRLQQPQLAQLDRIRTGIRQHILRHLACLRRQKRGRKRTASAYPSHNS